MVNSKQYPSHTLKLISRLLLGIIGLHILLMMIGFPYSDQGGWLVLYFLMILCLPSSAILYCIGNMLEQKYKALDEANKRQAANRDN